MTASIFGAAFDRLPRETQSAISKQLRTRLVYYTHAMKRGYYDKVRCVIIGDTPGPGRPKDKNYHHTPFYSTKNSSFWLNKMLVENNIDEKQLLWFNSTLANGDELDPIHIKDLDRRGDERVFIVLGGNAEKWFKKAAPGVPYYKVFHPQYAKRFRSKEPYALIDLLKEPTRDNENV
jgi:hypothetical protein